MKEQNTMEVRGTFLGKEIAVTLHRVAGRIGERRQWRSPLDSEVFIAFFPSNKAPEYIVMLAVPETEDPATLRGDGATLQDALDALAQRVQGLQKWAEGLQAKTETP